jgi:UDP-GlcNAc3NAcA epimerase
MKRVLSVIGARPQFVKAAAVSPALAAAGLDEYVVHTGQHYDRQMSEVFFQEMGLRPPDLNLSVGSGSHASQTGAMLLGLERAISERQPDCVLVYGDTNSTLAGALAAAKLHVPVAHVEAGLRSFNRRMPEEINRVVADALASILFIPTETARRNLEREGVPPENTVMTGDVMYDVVLMFRERAAAAPGILGRLKINGGCPYVLATVHRAENTDDAKRLRAILAGLAKVAKHLRVILPLHPRTRSRLASLPDAPLGEVEVIEPAGFLDMMRLEMRAQVIATDSGGVQKEAFFHHVPCVTLRNETEWPELVDLGWNRLIAPQNAERIAETILSSRGAKGRTGSPYGDGHASERIADALKQRLPAT